MQVLFYKCTGRCRMCNIKLFIMDVDGTLTDGKLYIGNKGEVLKTFSIKDGLGIKKLLSHGIIPVILTGRTSEIVSYRASELGMSEVYQGFENKLALLEELLEKHNCTFENIAYIGDDENDLSCMNHAHITGCPSNAVQSVKKLCTFCSEYKGGDGAVRDFIEYIISQQRLIDTKLK